MKKNKALLTIVIGCMTVVMLYSIAAFAAPAKNAKYSVDAAEIEYDMKSGDGTTTGKTTIKYDGGVERLGKAAPPLTARIGQGVCTAVLWQIKKTIT